MTGELSPMAEDAAASAAGAPPVPPAPPALADLHLLLDLDAGAAATLKREAAALLTPERRPVTRKMRQTFRDTTDHRIGKAGLALAIQTAGRKRVQLLADIRRPPAGGRVTTRHEIPLATEGLDVTRLAFVPGIDPSLVAALDHATLVPVFAIDLTRTSWRARLVDATLAVSLETAEIEAAAGRRTLVQLDISRLSGPDEAVYRLARKLAGMLPFRLADEDAVQAGYRLATGKAPWRAAQQGAPLLRPDMTVREGFLAIGREGAAEVRDAVAALAAHPGAEPIHQARVALRRLRSVLSVFKAVLPPIAARQYGNALSALATTLGHAREWDVLLETTIQPLESAIGPEPMLQALADAAAARRDAAAVAIAKEMGSTSFTLLSLGLGSWFDAGLWPDSETPSETALLERPMVEYARRLLKKRHQRFVEAGDGAAGIDAEHLHQVRIQAKKLRYAVEFLRELFPAKPARRYIAALKEIQEILGTANDATTAQSLVPRLVADDQAPGARAAGLVAGWSAAEAAAARRQFAAAWEEFRETKRFW